MSHDAMDELAWLSDDALEDLRDDLFELPGIDLSLHVELPDLTGRDRRRLQRAITDPDSEGAWEMVRAVAVEVDTPQERLRLAEALVRLREEGRLGRRHYALAMFDLSRGGEYLITAGVIHALATHLGGDPTPAGILVAA
jgi:hypothetical protein